jgi:dihydroorotate dehydrogenase (fumarate)
MAGATVTMTTSELLKNGPQRVNEMVDEMTRWMEEHEYESVTQLRGSMSQRNVAQPDAFVRANYMKVLQSWRPDPAGMKVR